jgi:hypothetical protein
LRLQGEVDELSDTLKKQDGKLEVMRKEKKALEKTVAEQ